MLFHLRTSWAPDFLEGAPQFYFYLFIYFERLGTTGASVMRCSMLTALHMAGTSWDLNRVVRKAWSSQLLSAVPRLQPAAAPSWWPADYFYQRGWECLGCDEMCVFRVHLAWKAPFFPFFPLGWEGGRRGKNTSNLL